LKKVIAFILLYDMIELEFILVNINNILFLFI